MSKLHEIPLPPMVSCACKRFYIMRYLDSKKELRWQVKDFIGGGTAVYLHDDFVDAMTRLRTCTCQEE
jgi:hypothetical protein